ncbi:acetylserotonin O-methyltransferase-like [Spinacia oleracea]|uniref:Acetylserotonin O-methyltransferase-like n=1 Tax=Spinacia oleracea TaxID=3562 RepID=A0ABM3R4G0_SPIOL|nr:acetylserotonin O-methyltransferase-like [Spinacia oleracea]
MEQTMLRDVTNGEHRGKEEEEEAEASVDIWRYVFGFTEMAIVKCANDLGIADVFHKNGGSMSTSRASIFPLMSATFPLPRNELKVGIVKARTASNMNRHYDQRE